MTVKFIHLGLLLDVIFTYSYFLYSSPYGISPQYLSSIESFINEILFQDSFLFTFKKSFKLNPLFKQINSIYIFKFSFCSNFKEL